MSFPRFSTFAPGFTTFSTLSLSKNFAVVGSQENFSRYAGVG